jgi:DNA invertase Pin-like site-specific DNA recombinase
MFAFTITRSSVNEKTGLFHFAEFERDLINERTAEGWERAKAKGTHMGRKGKSEKEVQKALKLFLEREDNRLSVNEIVKMTGLPRSTIYAKNNETLGK